MHGRSDEVQQMLAGACETGHTLHSVMGCAHHHEQPMSYQQQHQQTLDTLGYYQSFDMHTQGPHYSNKSDATHHIDHAGMKHLVDTRHAPFSSVHDSTSQDAAFAPSLYAPTTQFPFSECAHGAAALTHGTYMPGSSFNYASSNLQQQTQSEHQYSADVYAHADPTIGLSEYNSSSSNASATYNGIAADQAGYVNDQHLIGSTSCTTSDRHGAYNAAAHTHCAEMQQTQGMHSVSSDL